MEITTYPRGKFRISVSKVAEIAGKIWEAGEVECIGSYDATDYARRMLTSCAETALWTDAEHDDDADGTGEYQSEVDNLRFSYAPDFEEALPKAARDELESDVEGFLMWAWPYLSRDKISPEQAGHEFHLARGGNSGGFQGRGHVNEDALSTLARTFGTFGLSVTGHGYAEDGCDVCGEDIAHVIGPVQDVGDEWVHVDRAITDHKPSGPIRVYDCHN